MAGVVNSETYYLGAIKAKRPKGFLGKWYFIDLRLCSDKEAILNRLKTFSDFEYDKKLYTLKEEDAEKV
ncbi:MAG TPA: hypothetical protein VI815_02275 [Candidatus Nanoarchaeia archaeon]|nr:hypothetical protein [Candidatus Nanoarchaeia archaeon]